MERVTVRTHDGFGYSIATHLLTKKNVERIYLMEGKDPVLVHTQSLEVCFLNQFFSNLLT